MKDLGLAILFVSFTIFVLGTVDASLGVIGRRPLLGIATPRWYWFAWTLAAVAVVVGLAACGDNLKPPLPPCPDGNHFCGVDGVCTLGDGSQCQLSEVDGGVP